MPNQTEVRAGSYDPRSLEDSSSELVRLRAQAELFRTLESRLLTESGLRSTDSTLELGCGPGFVSSLLTELANDGALISIDNNADFLALRQSEIKNKPTGGTLGVEASVNSLPILSDWADFAYARFLFQHVPSPQCGIDEVFRVTAPGGRFCVVDSDDGLVVHHPHHAEIDSFLTSVQEEQSALGGDRFVGRKILSMMRQAGFGNVKARIITFTSTDIPFRALFNVVFGYKSAIAGKVEEMEELFKVLGPLAGRGEFLLSTGVFVVVGEK